MNKHQPLSLYIHIPWCIQKCPYCDFNSHAVTNSPLNEEQYIYALVNEAHSKQALIKDRPIHTIFIGGGTPSLFSSAAYKALFTELKLLLNLNGIEEITLEANPGTVDQQHFNGYFNCGINRLSIGVQSFQDHHLQKIGRIHDSQKAKMAFSAAKQAGFKNINIDLMFGLPNQTIAEALDDLHQAIQLDPTHISWYQLTIEPHTYFYRFPPRLPNDDLLMEMQQAGQALLKQHGYLQYEISAYTKPGYQCRHNLNYWQFGDYLGIGAGAHSKISDANKQTITRYANVKHPRAYLNANHQNKTATEQIVTPEERPLEFMMNVLRLLTPTPLSAFEERTFLPPSQINSTLAHAIAQGWLNQQKIKKGELATTPHGRQFLNELLELFITTPLSPSR